MKQERSTLLVLLALVFVLAGGPTLALCDVDAGGGCCCHDRHCPLPVQGNVQACCGSDDGAPDPLEDVAQPTVSDPIPTVDPGQAVSSDDADAVALAFDTGFSNRPDPAPPPLFTLHAALLI